MKIRIAGVVRNSFVDGPGIRYTVFAQGCPHNCKDCHNLHTHDFSGGSVTETEKIAGEIKKDPLLDGVTFSGGEPFCQIEAFIELADLLADYHVICYTGYTFEELYEKPDARELLKRINLLIDGRFEASKRSVELKFRGSANQRVIDSKESVKCGKVVETSL
jgi:anaerobic ribonucleoside-triphosphate reductase activating protein